MLEWVKFWIAALLLITGLIFFVGGVIGNCRFRYIMNRVHAAGLGDTMGLFFVLLSLMISSDTLLEIGKLCLPLIFLWICSPVSSHFLAQIEYYTNRHFYDYMNQ